MNAVLLTEKVTEFWKNELKACISELPVYMDALKRNHEPKQSRLIFSLGLKEDQAGRLGLIYNLDVVWLACYLAFLHRVSGETDLLVGFAGAGGQLLPLRVLCQGEDTMKQLIGRLTDKLILSMEHDLPLSQISRALDEPLKLTSLFGGGLPKAPEPFFEGCLWSWSVCREQGDWQLYIDYDSSLFSEEAVRRYASHYKRIADAALDNIHSVIGLMDIVNSSDNQAYLRLNATGKQLPPEQTIVDRFAAVAKASPGKIAFSSGGAALTYRELDERSNRIAGMLLESGLAKGDFAAIFMERSMDAVVSLMGVLKAGGTYIPLDPEHPEERNAYILSDTRSRFILTKASYLEKVHSLCGLSGQEERRSIFSVDQELSRYSGGPLAPVGIMPDDLAYVIYTSGSTGRPKGALIAHKGVVNLAMAIRDDLDLQDDDILLQYSTFSFDASVYDVFGSMLNGTRLHLLSYEERFSTDSFTEAVKRVRATRISILPTVFFNQLAVHTSLADADAYAGIRSVVVGGEALSGEAVRQFQNKLGGHIKIVNAYGPTECTVASTTYTVSEPVPEHVSTICIGTPLANYELYIVNAYDRLCPVNVTGELLISSVGVGKGYLNQPEKTAQAFIADPVHPGSGKTFYRSGDMVRLLANGQVEYMGRKDSQVKIRGYRIEIGEIEDNLTKHETVQDAAVIAREDIPGEKRLVAFYRSRSGSAVPKQELVHFLGKKVPGYMIPEHFEHLEQLPVTPSGKVDRKKLAVLPLQEDEDTTGGEYAAPQNELEEQVAHAWQKALHRTRISTTEHFFEIGGHSIKILEILAELKPQYPKLKINDFFQYPTIEQLAARIGYLQNEEETASSEEWKSGPVRDLVEHPLQFGNTGSLPGIYPTEHILLTGSTGYLGSHILAELLKRSEARISCLIRPHGEYADPFDRLAAVMSRYFGDAIVETLRSRVIMVQGDLEKEDLGLQAEDRCQLEKQIDAVIHCGAEVKHFGDAEYFTRVNVDSTRRLLELAGRKPGVRFHYISTLGIPEELALSGQWDDFLASPGYPDSAYVDNVYTESKLEAEREVAAACERDGIPVAVYRIGNLSCRSDNGVFQQNIDNNAFYRMLKAMILLGATPQVDSYVDLTPVDYAGAAIAALLLQKDGTGKMYHICNPVQLPYEELVGHLQAYGYRIGFKDLQDYEAWLLDGGADKDREGLQMAMAHLEGDGAKHSNWRFSCAHTTQYLAESNIICKAPGGEYLRKLVDHAVGVGYFPAP